ncbi:DinB family protein [Acidobacteria bacterium AB60]|nr:DinB family protein [Acidobacteria bacterium AB60]
MSALNPYDSFLDGRPVEEIIAATPREVSRLIEAIGPARSFEPPAPGKWSPGEIVAHLADCELVFGFRLRQTLAEDGHTLQPFDQEKWAKSYHGITPEEALRAFKALREWNLILLEDLPAEARARKVTHPERGTMTFQTIVETMAGHDLNHLGQLRKIAGTS